MERKIILLVEDNPDDVLLTKRVFKKYNLLNEIVVAQDGAEALDILLGDGTYPGKEEGGLPALILLDINLPKVGGLDVLKQLRANEKTNLVPIVLLTSSKEEQDVLRGYQLGANSYVRKPVVFEDFSATVHQLGMYWLLLNEPLP
ncbi:MAG: response regulator [Candidatus Marinimicrobia bacterium]|nr:response regulator [Candidatus Neomarinimicrobiota bacterium]